jgi:dihydroorotate dehydrogenase
LSVLTDLGVRALRLLPPEAAHTATIRALRAGAGPVQHGSDPPILRTRLAGLDLPNPIGLAAGFDKNAEVPDAMLAAGFGFVECGTVTPLAQAGNPKPRLFRLEEDGAVINRLGFNNEGLAPFCARMRRRSARPGVVGANIGVNKDAADRIADYVLGLRRVWLHARYVTVNISSPNTPGLRGLQDKSALEDLLAQLGEARAPLERAHGRRPLFLKVAPDIDETAVRDIAEAALAARLDGLIVSNTTIARPETLTSRHRGQTGGLSGKPLMAPSTQVLALFRTVLGDRLPLIGVGGIASGADAYAKIRAGASAVQLYTGLVYGGPSLVQTIKAELADRLKADGFAKVADAVGQA